MNRVSFTTPALLALALLLTACSSSSEGGAAQGNSLGDYSCGGGTTASGCTGDCQAKSVSWSFDCDTTVAGHVSCTCTSGPKQGFQFEEPTACQPQSEFDGADQCT